MQYIVTSAKGVLALILVCLMGAMGYLHFNKADFSRRVLGAINNALTTDIRAERFSLDVLTHFPYVTARLQDVSIEGLDDSRLLDASEVQVLLHPGRLLRGELEVNRLYIEDGRIDVHMLPDRTLSMNIFKPAATDDKKQGLVLDFRQVVMSNIALRFHDQVASQEYSLTFDKLRLRGRMGYQQISLDLDGDFMSHRVRVGDLKFLNACRGSISGMVHLDLKQQLYRFDDLGFMLNGEKFNIDGSLRGDKAYTFVDLSIGHPEGKLSRFAKLLPPSFVEVLDATGLQGRFGASGSIKGRMSQEENPYVEFELSVPDGIVEVDSQVHIPVVIKGKFSNGGMRQMSSSELELQSIEGSWEGHDFSGMMRLIDMRDPAIQVLFRGALPASVVGRYVPGLEVSHGTIFLDDVASGRMWIDDLHYTDLRKMQGTARLEQVAFSFDGRDGHIAHAGLYFDEGDVRIDSLDVKWQRSSGRISGTVGKLPEALQAMDAGLLTYDLELDMDAIYFEDLRATNGQTNHVRPASIQSYAAPLRLPAGSALITAGRFSMDRMAVSELQAQVETRLHDVEFSCNYKGMEGALEASGNLAIKDAGYMLDTKVTCQDINVKQCFWQFRDFGQSTIRAEHLDGRLDAILLGHFAWFPDGNVNRDAIQLRAGISIDKGELTGFDLLEKFSSYIHAEDLRHIRFEHLNNYIEVKNGRIYLPVMFIQSNAVNLAINGVHGFDNSILYNVKINAGQVLSQKMKVHDPSLSPIPARKEGTFNLFYTIEGDISDFRYRSGKRGVTSSFEQSKDLRTSIRDILTEHFEGARDLIEPAEWESIPEYEESLMPGEFLDPISGKDF